MFVKNFEVELSSGAKQNEMRESKKATRILNIEFPISNTNFELRQYHKRVAGTVGEAGRVWEWERERERDGGGVGA